MMSPIANACARLSVRSREESLLNRKRYLDELSGWAGRRAVFLKFVRDLP
ncbi:hypothetical protein [Salmonella phage SD-12_S18]|nr:hypothetical protein [Salmonella phage SD-12_S18]